MDKDIQLLKILGIIVLGLCDQTFLAFILLLTL
jgi:hypothetical protein